MNIYETIKEVSKNQNTNEGDLDKQIIKEDENLYTEEDTNEEREVFGPVLLIESNRDSYSPKGYTCTVRDLISYLEDFDDDLKVYISDNRYTFGSLSIDDLDTYYWDSDGSEVDAEGNIIEDAEQFFEAANPENAEANELIYNSLKDKEYAVAHKDELKKHGIDVDVQSYGDDPADLGHAHVFLKGENGRRLRVSNLPYRWDTMTTIDIEPRQSDYEQYDGINKYNPKTDKYDNAKDLRNDFTLPYKSYKDSKTKVKEAKAILPTLKKRLNLYERRYGKDSEQYRQLANEIKANEAIVSEGIHALHFRKLSKDIDYKNYLNKPLRFDRDKPRERYSKNSYWTSDGVTRDGTEVDKANATSREYKTLRYQQRHNENTKKDNLERDKEDLERIADYTKRFNEEKKRRDSVTEKVDRNLNKQFDEIYKKLDKYKKRLGKKN